MQASNITKGVVLKTVKYGDTSIIASIFTELYGLRSYMIKGARKASKKSAGTGQYYQPSNFLLIEGTHQEQRQLQFIKSVQWAVINANILQHVVKNTVAMFMVEVLSQSIKETEPNAELYDWIEELFTVLNEASDKQTANLPLYFMLHLGAKLGFALQHNFSMDDNCYLDIKNGCFVASYNPNNGELLDTHFASITNEINKLTNPLSLAAIAITKQDRNELIDMYVLYLQLHVPEFYNLKSLPVLRAIFQD